MSPTEGRRLCCVESCRRAMLAGRPVLSTHLHWSHNEVFWPQLAGCSSQLWCVGHWRWARVLILHRYDCVEYLYSTGMTVLSTYIPQVWLCWVVILHRYDCFDLLADTALIACPAGSMKCQCQFRCHFQCQRCCPCSSDTWRLYCSRKATEHWLFPTTWTPSIARHFICI